MHHQTEHARRNISHICIEWIQPAWPKKKLHTYILPVRVAHKEFTHLKKKTLDLSIMIVSSFIEPT